MQLKNIVDNMILFEEKYLNLWLFADFGILVCVISVCLVCLSVCLSVCLVCGGKSTEKTYSSKNTIIFHKM